MRAAIYARVSSAAQRDRHTIESQLRVLRAHVPAQGWTIAGEWIDDGRSAKSGKLDARDGFAELVRAAESRAFDVLVVVDVDRLTRTDSIEERALILGPFQRLGIDIVTPSGGRLDMRTMLGELWVTIQALGAAEENRKRAERIKAGKARAIAENRKPAGPTPFGLKFDRPTGEWSLDPPAAAVLREMILRVAGGESCVTVADDLIARRAVGNWTRDKVYRLVHNGYATGTWCVNKKTGQTLTVPAIVSAEEWAACQAALRRSQRAGLNRTKHTYLLQSLARCGECGEPMVVRSGVKYYNAQREPREHPAMYMCRSHPTRLGGCPNPTAKVTELDDRVWAALCAELERPEIVAELADVEAVRSGEAKDWESDAAGYRAHLERLGTVEANFLQLARRGRISDEGLELELAEIARERTMLRDQLATAERAAGANVSERERLRAARDVVARLRSALPKATPEQRQALLRELVPPDGVTILDRRVTLDLRLSRTATAASGAGNVAISLVGVVSDSGYRVPHVATLRLRLVA